VQIAKSDPEAQRKSPLLDCTWLENEFGSFNLETLKFLMHFREPGSSFILLIVTFFLFFFSYIFFSLSLFSFSLSRFFFSIFFICSP
jgi:hypothetical protein